MEGFNTSDISQILNMKESTVKPGFSEDGNCSQKPASIRPGRDMHDDYIQR